MKRLLFQLVLLFSFVLIGFNSIGQAPSIAFFYPSSGPVGTSVTIMGNNLQYGPAVFINGLQQNITSSNSSQIIFTIKVGTATGFIQIFTGYGNATSSVPYTVTGPPTITSFSPSSGLIGTNVTVNGTNFYNLTSFTIGGVAANVVSNSGTQLVGTVMSGATTGLVSVTTPLGTANSSSNFTVTYPTITSFTPSSGPVGTTVTITGTDINNLTSLTIGGVAADVISNSVTQIVGRVRPSAVTGIISATNTSGTANSSSNFTLTNAPSITSFSPVGGPVGTNVTVTGYNFTNLSSFKIAGIALNLASASDTLLIGTVMPGAVSGYITVTTPLGTGSSGNVYGSNTFTVTSSSPIGTNANWTWMKGDSISNQPSIYGSLGVPAVSNKPGARKSEYSWTDASGDFWLFGGYGSAACYTPLNKNNDLWKYSVISNQWTWVNGDSVQNKYGVYGLKGVPSFSNKPGSRAGGVSWTDNGGNFWLFGGGGVCFYHSRLFI